MQTKIENRAPAMRLYTLTRIDPSATVWESDIELPLVLQVWAQDEAQARYCAGAKFKVYSPKGSPWLRVDHVRVEAAESIEPGLPVLMQARKLGAKGRPKSTDRLILRTPRPDRSANRPN